LIQTNGLEGTGAAANNTQYTFTGTGPLACHHHHKETIQKTEQYQVRIKDKHWLDGMLVSATLFHFNTSQEQDFFLA
jgi:hypothetical protein